MRAIRHSVLVTSWRDTASQQAQDDLDGLLNAALPFAQEMLEKHGDFLPYGVSLSLEGEGSMVTGYEGDERPISSEVLSLLIDGLRQQRDRLRAAALVSDVRAGGSDAIRVELEHSEGPTMAVLLPYQKKRLRRGVEYGSLQASASTGHIWT